MEIIFLIGRILFGGVFLMFGIIHFKDKKEMVEYIKSKNVESPALANLVAALILTISGLFIILGIFSEVAAVLLTVFLIAVSTTMHNFWTISDPKEKQMQMIYFMMNMALIGANFMMIHISYWPLSL
jgi:putative oxidoreductase